MEVSISMEYHGVYGHTILSVLYIYYMVTRYSKQLWLLIRYSGLVAIAYAICLYSVYIYRSDYCRKDDRPKIIKCLNRNISYLSYRRTGQRTFCTYYDSGHMYRYCWWLSVYLVDDFLFVTSRCRARSLSCIWTGR